MTSQRDDDLLYDLRRSCCPDCGGEATLEHGPKGGLSLNVRCTACGARFNCGGGVISLAHTFFAERLSDAEKPELTYRRRARERYHDTQFEVRLCEREACGKSYAGPAVYRSLGCAEQDA